MIFLMRLAPIMRSRAPYHPTRLMTVVDFACLQARLIVEVDGSQHLLAVKRDEERTARLQSRGFRVLRFWDNDVLQHTESVLERIRLALVEGPHPALPGEGEGRAE
jgi:very-short-patch-repair endonuclease